jgi:hypothetical protein
MDPFFDVFVIYSSAFKVNTELCRAHILPVKHLASKGIYPSFVEDSLDSCLRVLLHCSTLKAPRIVSAQCPGLLH